MSTLDSALTDDQRYTLGYQPTSRRPIADSFRKTAFVAVRVCVDGN